MFIFLPMWIIDTWFYASYVATYMYSDFRRVCYLILQNVPKLLCASVANAAGICETSKTMKWHQKILWKEIDVQRSGNCCTHAVGRKDLTLICPLTQARAAHTTQQCAPIVYIFAVLLSTPHNPCWHSDLAWVKGRGGFPGCGWH